jgi:hypothetical protein
VVAGTGGHYEKTTKSHWKGSSTGKNGNEKEQETPSDGEKYPRKVKF